MSKFNIEPLELEGAYIIENFYSGDLRGGFSKVFEKNKFFEGNIDFSLSETFYSISSKNVLRGLHFQTHNPQAKLICVPCGKVFDVIVDLRINSPTFKSWIGIELSEENHKSIYIPRGFAHGFLSLEDNTIMLYQCDGAYDRDSDTGILYNAPEIGVDWPIDDESTIHSTRDLQLMTFDEYLKNPIEYI